MTTLGRVALPMFVVSALLVSPGTVVHGQSPTPVLAASHGPLGSRQEGIDFLLAIAALPVTDDSAEDGTYRWTGSLGEVTLDLEGAHDNVEAARLRAHPASLDEAIAVSEVIGPWLKHFAPVGAFEALGGLGTRFMNGAHESFDLGDRILRVDTTLTGEVVDMVLEVRVDPAGPGPAPPPGWIATIGGPGDFEDPDSLDLAAGSYRVDWEVSESSAEGCHLQIELVGTEVFHRLANVDVPAGEALVGSTPFDVSAGPYHFSIRSDCRWSLTLRAD